MTAHDPDKDEVLRLLRLYGWNATAYQIVNPGLDRWFPPDRDAVIASVVRARTRIVAGAPVCHIDRLARTVDQWEAENDALRLGSCYFGAAGRMARLLEADDRFCRVVLGAQPVWDPQTWPQKFDDHASLRAQLLRARNKGVTVREMPVEEASAHPELQRVLREWLSRRGLPPLHFLVEPETLRSLDDKRVFVARLGDRPVGFVTMAPVPARRGWLTEQFVRGLDAPNGTIESIVDTAVRAVARDGAQYVTMGLVPLANIDPAWMDSNPPWLRVLAMWARAHGRRFYNFQGLESFKTKFRPDGWEPIYAFSKEARFSVRALRAISAAFTRTPPEWALLLGLGRAARIEAQSRFASRPRPAP